MFLTITVLALVTAGPCRAAATPGWVHASNKLADEFGRDGGTLFPEQASSTGYRDFDAGAIQMDNTFADRKIQLLKRWEKRLGATVAKNPDEKIDVQVLRTYVRIEREGLELDERLGLIDFMPVSQFVYNSLNALINAQSDATRKAAGVRRFHDYVRGHGNYRPLTEAFQDAFLAFQRRHAKTAIVYPLAQEVERYLADNSAYVSGIGELLKDSGVSGWESDFHAFQAQTSLYVTFIQTNVRPKVRTSYQLPLEKYAWLLKKKGLNIAPEALIAMAHTDYDLLYKRFRVVAAEVAKEHGLTVTEPPQVIAELKKQQVTQPKEVEALFQDAAAFLDKVIRDNDLVSLPKTPLKIRLLGAAESKARPVPQLIQPPVVDNHGERPEFVVPTAAGGALPFDDFSYKAAALVLTAHEGRPGHDLQFSTMLDNGVSTIRGTYAANSVNIEGWALYAEDLAYSFMPKDSQLVALQTRLWRMARAYLDPEIQLGRIAPERVVEVFVKELGVSPTMAGLELRRYTYDDPGQAPSYYFGWKKFLAARADIEQKLGPSFSLRCFHDAVLEMGLVPMDLVAKHLHDHLVCPNTAARR